MKKHLGSEMGISTKATLLITAWLLVAATGVAWTPLQAATATATVDAKIISSLSIATRTGLGFGDVSADAVAGTVVMTPTGNRSVTGGTTINTATTASAASFDLTGIPSSSFAITLPASVILSDGATNSLVVDGLTTTPSRTGTLDGNGQGTLYVGGTLNVKSNQPYGVYSGQLAVTVEYN